MGDKQQTMMYFLLCERCYILLMYFHIGITIFTSLLVHRARVIYISLHKNEIVTFNNVNLVVVAIVVVVVVIIM